MPSSSEFENFENTEKDRWGIIKNWLQDNQADIVLVIGIILIALISFGLGWLSAPKNAGNNSVIIEDVGTGAILDNTKQESNNEQNAANQNAANNETANPNSQQQGIIVASKNGTKYH